MMTMKIEFSRDNQDKLRTEWNNLPMGDTGLTASDLARRIQIDYGVLGNYLKDLEGRGVLKFGNKKGRIIPILKLGNWNNAN